MSHFDIRSAVRPQPDQPMVDIADYVIDYTIDSQEAYDTARYMLLDSLACAMLAMKFPDCVKHLGPLVPGRDAAGRRARAGHQLRARSGRRPRSTSARMVRWLDFNDTWLAAEWGHPSDNLGAILAVADYLSRARAARRRQAADRARRARPRRSRRTRSRACYALQNTLQPRRPRPRHPGPPRLDRRRDRDARRQQGRRSSTRCRTPGSTTARCAPTATRRTPARARAGPPATPAAAPCIHALNAAQKGEVGYPSALSRQDLGLLRRAVQGQAVRVRAAVRQLRDGERAVQDLLPGRIPRPDRGRVRDAAAPAGQGPASTRSSGSRSRPRKPASASSTRPARWPTTPTATTASSTWSPCR